MGPEGPGGESSQPCDVALVGASPSAHLVGTRRRGPKLVHDRSLRVLATRCLAAAACTLLLLLGAHALEASGAEPIGQRVTDPRGVAPESPNPLVGLRFFVDPQEPSW